MGHIETRKQCGGFTLAEMLVALLVGVMVLVGIYRIFVGGLGAQTTTSLQTEVDRSAQVAMDDMIDRLRGGWTVLLAYPDRIAFTDQNGGQVCYWVDDRTLYRAANTTFSGGVAVSPDVVGLEFTYRDRYGQEITDLSDAPAQAVRVEVELTVARDAYPHQTGEALRYSTCLKSAARLRNKQVL